MTALTLLMKRCRLLFIVLFVFVKAPAQLCKGSLGDPIINITFGSGSNPGAALTTTKNLNYISADCPNDGNYTVRNNTSNCFNNTWHALNADHTGNANGYFMLINASLQKSEFYIDTLKGLCPSTNYEFAAWVMNIILPSACGGNTIKPNLTFNIERTDGTVLQTYSTGDIAATPTPLWKQYGFFFNTPAAVSDVVLRILNNSTGGCGNDIAIDDITFRPCGPQLTPSIRGVSGKVKELCAGNNTDVTLECNVSAGYSNPAYLWQQSKDGGNTWTDIVGETSISLLRSFASATPVGDYLYRITVGEASNAGLPSCKIASEVLTVRVNSLPVATVSANSPVCEGSTLMLSAGGTAAGAQYVWSGVNSFSAAGASVSVKNVSIASAGKYFIQVTDSKGCHHLDSATVIVHPTPAVTTAFTNKTICQGDSVLLGSAGGPPYLWSPAGSLSSAVIANPVAKPAVSTVYKVAVTNTFSCTDSAVVSISVTAAPHANAGSDKVMVEGQSVQLDGGFTGSNTSISWSPNFFINDIHSLRPVVNPVADISYILTVTSNNGCGVASDTTNIRVFKKVIVPNAFSPNGDGVNDTWNITALASYNDYEISVFNRYGNLVFQTKNYSDQWNGTFNGKPLPVATYYYLIDLKLGLPRLKGFVVILR